jgi:hypothetical protein
MYLRGLSWEASLVASTRSTCTRSLLLPFFPQNRFPTVYATPLRYVAQVDAVRVPTWIYFAQFLKSFVREVKINAVPSAALWTAPFWDSIDHSRLLFSLSLGENQKNAMLQDGSCGVGRLYSCASRPDHVVQRRTNKCCKVYLTASGGGSGHGNGQTVKRDNTELLTIQTTRTTAAEGCPSLLLWFVLVCPSEGQDL